MPIDLLVIDPQNDFCDPTGALYVPGAEQDMARLARMVRALGAQISAIHVTLDSHHLLHVAHPLFWQDAAGQPPAPFTIIRTEDVETGRWTPALPGGQARALAYVQALEREGRYPLCIWPPHCLIGSPGHAVAPELFAALQDWEGGLRVVNYVFKGSNVWTEHYSAIQADVADPADPATQPNEALIQRLRAADVIAVAGEASSHCVANTVRDLAGYRDKSAALQKLVVLTNAMSPVPGFEGLQEAFFQEMAARGARLASVQDFAACPG